MNIVKLLAAGVPRVLGGVEGMTFPVFKYTDCVDGRGMMAHVCDYRYPTSAEHKTVSPYQIWSLPPEGYEVVNAEVSLYELDPHYGRTDDPRTIRSYRASRDVAEVAIKAYNDDGANCGLAQKRWGKPTHTDLVWSPVRVRHPAKR